MKKLLTFFLTALLTFSVGWAETVTLSNANIVNAGTGASGYNNWTITDGNSNTWHAYAIKNQHSNATSGYHYLQIKKYASNTAYYIQVPELGTKITQIVMTVSNSNQPMTGGGNSQTLFFSSSNSTSATGTGVASGTGSSTVTIDCSSLNLNTGYITASGAVRIWDVTVTYVDGGTTVTPPTITPNGGSFVGSQQVTISHDDADAIYYTTNGAEPTTSSTLYTAPFTITETTTVKAIAVKNGVSSSPATATFTNIGVGTIADAYALAQNSQFIFTGSAVVTYQNGRNVWIRDNSGSGLIYRAYSDQGTLNNGDILDAGWSATNTTYNGIREFSNPTGVASSSNGGAVTPFDRTSTGVTNANVNEYVSFSHVTPAFDNSIGYCYVTIGNNTVYFRNYFNNGQTVTSNHTYDIEGIVYIESGNTFVYMTKVTEITTTNPLLEVSPDELTISDSGTNNTFHVEGSNLGNDDVGVTVPQGSEFSTTTDDESWGFENNGGSVNGTATVTYGGRKLYATETVTVANNIISATVDVTYEPDLYIVGNFGSGWDFSAGGATSMTNNGDHTYTATLQNIPANSYILFCRATGVTYNWENDANRLFIGTETNGGDWAFGTNTSGNLDTDPTNDSPVKYHPIVFPEAGTYTITITVNPNNGTGTFSIEKETESSGDFVLVTNAADLVAGNEVIFVNKGEQGDWLAMSTEQRPNNRGTTSVTVTPTLKVTATQETQIATLEGDASGWYFNVGNGYLYAADSNNNYLRTRTEKGDDNAKATISISNNQATIRFQGSNTHNLMRFNGTLVSCYTSGQSPVYLYQRAGSTEPSITVNPASLDLVIPVGESSVSGNVTVTETNTTGTTSVAVSGTGANYFSATLENGTLTVTYNGNATMTSPDVATITLTNGDATATVNVTGYKCVEATGTLYSKVTNANQIQDGLQYIIVFEGNDNIPVEALNGITTGGTGAQVSWEEQGSIVNISGTDVIEFTLNGNASAFTLSSDHGYLNPASAPNLMFGTEGETWSAESNNGGYVLMWGNYMMRYNSGASAANGRFRIYDGTTGTPVYLYVQGSAVATPVITPASGNYAEDQEVTITCATTGATIYYTVNGGETQTYNGPFTVDVDEDHTTTTIAAWAEDGEQHHSPTVTVTYTYKKDHVSSIVEFLALDNGEEVIFDNPVVVLFDYSQNSSGGQEYIWIKDRTGYTQLFITPQFDNDSVADPQYNNSYGNFVPKYENGDVIPAGFKVKKNFYSTGQYVQAMCTDTHNTFQIAEDKALADPEQVKLSDLLANPADYNNRYLYINKLQVNYSGTGLNFTISADENGDNVSEVQGGSAIVGYNKYNSPAWKNKQGVEIGVDLPTDNNYYNVKFIFQQWSNGYEIMPIEFTQWEETSLLLEDLVKVGEEGQDYTISNQLHAVAVTWDGEKNMFAIFAKDDGMYANKRYPATGQDTYLIRYENQNGTFINEVEQEDYDQSNWIEILIPSTITQVTSKTTDVNAYIQELGNLQSTFENKILDAGSVLGTYVDALNPTIEVTALPTVASLSTYEPNIYCTANFLMENLDTDGAQGNDGNYFMMDAKPHEFCKVVWAYYDNSNGNYFVIPAREGNTINGHGFHGSFMANLSLSSDAQIYYDYDNISTWITESNDPSFNGQQFIYTFDAVVRKAETSQNQSNGAPRRIQPGTGDFEQNPAYIVYPIISNYENPEGTVSVKELLGGKTIESIHYYNMMGMESKTPFEGINIVVTRYTDGSTSTYKVMK